MLVLPLASLGRRLDTKAVSKARAKLQRANLLPLWDYFRFIMSLAYAGDVTTHLRVDKSSVGTGYMSASDGPSARTAAVGFVQSVRTESRERENGLGYDKDARQSEGWSAGLYLRHGARGAARKCHQARPGALPGRTATRTHALSRLHRARLLRTGLAHPASRPPRGPAAASGSRSA